MSIAVSDDLIVITNTDPDTSVFLRYRPESGKVVVGAPDETGTLVDMQMLINALCAVKEVKDNERLRERGTNE